MQALNAETQKLEGPSDARAVLISCRSKIQISRNGVDLVVPMRTTYSADRFASAVVACGGEIVSREPLGRNRGYRVEFNMPIAWDAYLGRRSC